MVLPAHLREHGPGTGGRLVERDTTICARRAAGLTLDAIGREFKLSRETIRLIVLRGPRGPEFYEERRKRRADLRRRSP